MLKSLTYYQYAAYGLFILSVSVYFYWSNNYGLALLQDGQGQYQIPYFWGALALCWLGSVGVMAQRLRVSLKTGTVWENYLVAFIPIMVIPAVWLMLQLFLLLEI